MSFFDDRERNKRMIVPIVAIMMCVVAFIGLGYAYSSMVSSSNTVTHGEFYVDLGDYNTLSSGSYDYGSNDVNGKLDLTISKIGTKQGEDESYIYEVTEGGLTCLKVTSTSGASTYSLSETFTINNLKIQYYETLSDGSKGNLVSGNTFNVNQIYVVEVSVSDNSISFGSETSVIITITATSQRI